MVIGSRLSSVKRNIDGNRASLAASRGSPATRFRSAPDCCGGNVEIGCIPRTQEMFDFCAAQDVMMVRADETNEAHGVTAFKGCLALPQTMFFLKTTAPAPAEPSAAYAAAGIARRPEQRDFPRTLRLYGKKRPAEAGQRWRGLRSRTRSPAARRRPGRIAVLLRSYRHPSPWQCSRPGGWRA